MGGTRQGGKKSAQTIGRKKLAEFGRKGGSAKVKKGYALSGKASEAGRKGGLAKAEYRRRRELGLRGQGDKPNPVVSAYSPDEYLKRTNRKEYNKQKGVSDEGESDA